VKVYSRELYTGVQVIELDNNPYEKYFLVLQFLLNQYEKTGNVIDVGQLQILVIELPLERTKQLKYLIQQII